MSGPKKKKKAPEGAPEWMVTFGDLMSLLLTFFVLLFSVSEIKQKKIYEMIRSIRIHWQVDAPTAGFHMEQFSDVVLDSSFVGGKLDFANNRARAILVFQIVRHSQLKFHLFICTISKTNL